MFERASSPRLLVTVGALLATLVALVIAGALLLAPASAGNEVPVSTLLAGPARVQTAVLHDVDRRLTGTYVPGPKAAPVEFWSAYPASDTEVPSLLDHLSATGASVSVDRQQLKALLLPVLWVVLPLLIAADVASLVVLVVLLRRRRRAPRRAAGPVRMLADVAGADAAVAALRELARDVQQVIAGERSSHARLVAITAPPGAGATLLATAFAGEAGAAVVGPAAWGDGATHALPTVVLAEHIELATASEIDTVRHVLNDPRTGCGCVVVVTTTRAGAASALCDAAGGTLGFTLELPDPAGRLAILRQHARSHTLDRTVSLEDVVARTVGLAPADLAAIVDDAARRSRRIGRKTVLPLDFDDALDAVSASPLLRGRLLGPEERRRLAVHQAGHAITAAALGRGRQLHRVGIVSHAEWRTRAPGAVLSRSELLAQLTVLCGGIAAEELYFDEPSTLSEDDVAAATELAEAVAGTYGMSSQLGRARVGAPTEEFAREVRALIDDATSAATQRLQRCHEPLVDLVLQLERDEVIEGVPLGDLLIRALEVEVAGMGGPAASEPAAAEAPPRRGSRGTTIAR